MTQWKDIELAKKMKTNQEESLACDSCDYIGDRKTMIDHVIGTTHKIVPQEEEWEKEFEEYCVVIDIKSGKEYGIFTGYEMEFVKKFIAKTLQSERERLTKVLTAECKLIVNEAKQQAKESIIKEIEEWAEDNINYIKYNLKKEHSELYKMLRNGEMTSLKDLKQFLKK